jgi:hypothetical protein
MVGVIEIGHVKGAAIVDRTTRNQQKQHKAARSMQSLVACGFLAVACLSTAAIATITGLKFLRRNLHAHAF